MERNAKDQWSETSLLRMRNMKKMCNERWSKFNELFNNVEKNKNKLDTKFLYEKKPGPLL